MRSYSLQSDHPVPVVDIIVCNDNGDILLTRRDVEPYQGAWILPGGRIDVQDDSAEVAAVREVKEETGLDVSLTHLVDVCTSTDDPRFFVAQVVYAARVVGGDLTKNAEAGEFRWLRGEEAVQEKLGFNHREVLEHFLVHEYTIPVSRQHYDEWYGRQYPYTQQEYPRFASMAIVLSEYSEVLLAHRAQKPFIGLWDFPGGHMHVGETPEECLRREVREELGVDCQMEELFHVYSDKGQNPKNADVAAFYFVTIPSDSHFIKNVEMDDFRYFPLAEIPRELAYQNQLVIEDLKKRLGYSV